MINGFVIIVEKKIYGVATLWERHETCVNRKQTTMANYFGTEYNIEFFLMLTVKEHDRFVVK